jgi:hypothetical protein
MKTDVDSIIDLLKQYTFNDFGENKSEVGEQEEGGGASGGGPGYPAVTKWESGATRGVANQIGNTKWREINTITRGKANTLL